jgi:hypothetical protein
MRYSQFRVIRVGEFGLNPCSLSRSLIFLLGTLVLLETFKGDCTELSGGGVYLRIKLGGIHNALM